MTSDLVITRPGMYSIPDHTYHLDPVPGGSLSSSGARRLLPPSCPALFQHWRTHPEPSTKATDRGTAAHHRLLGVGPGIVVIDADDWRKPATRERGEKARAEGKVPLLLKDYATMVERERALRSHPRAAELFTPGAGLVEQSLFWVDQEFGVWRRARLDLLILTEGPGPVLIVDYKSCPDVDVYSLQKSMANFGYAKQGAYYQDAVAAVHDLPPEVIVFLLVFQMADPPYLVRVAQPHPDALELARLENRKAISVFRDCTASGVWDGYPADEIISLEYPRWETARVEAAWARGDLKTDTEVYA